MIRHGKSPKITGSERTRRLTEKGNLGTFKITELLKDDRWKDQSKREQRILKKEVVNFK